MDIIVTTDEARLSPLMVTETAATPTDGVARRSHKSSVSETDSRMFGGSSSVMSYASSFDPDNVALRHPVYSGLMSFIHVISVIFIIRNDNCLKIVRTVLCRIVCHSCTLSYAHLYEQFLQLNLVLLV